MSDKTDESTIKYLLKIDPTQRHFGTDDPEYLLDDLKEVFDECTELGKGFWALLRRSEIWIEVSFVEFASSKTDGSNTMVSHVFSSSGPEGSLRECRHSYFGPEAQGYVFYMDFGQMRAALKYMEQFFDGN